MVLGRSRPTFRCHDSTNVNKRERGREKHIEKHQTQSICKDIENVRYVCMKMHEHVMYNIKNIKGSAQSNPTSTQLVQQSKHTPIMHETLL